MQVTVWLTTLIAATSGLAAFDRRPSVLWSIDTDKSKHKGKSVPIYDHNNSNTNAAMTLTGINAKPRKRIYSVTTTASPARRNKPEPAIQRVTSRSQLPVNRATGKRPRSKTIQARGHAVDYKKLRRQRLLQRLGLLQTTRRTDKSTTRVVTTTTLRPLPSTTTPATTTVKTQSATVVNRIRQPSLTKNNVEKIETVTNAGINGLITQSVTHVVTTRAPITATVPMLVAQQTRPRILPTTDFTTNYGFTGSPPIYNNGAPPWSARPMLAQNAPNTLPSGRISSSLVSMLMQPPPGMPVSTEASMPIHTTSIWDVLFGAPDPQSNHANHFGGAQPIDATTPGLTLWDHMAGSPTEPSTLGGGVPVSNMFRDISHMTNSMPNGPLMSNPQLFNLRNSNALQSFPLFPNAKMHNPSVPVGTTPGGPTTASIWDSMFAPVF